MSFEITYRSWTKTKTNFAALRKSCDKICRKKYVDNTDVYMNKKDYMYLYTIIHILKQRTMICRHNDFFEDFSLRFVDLC